MYVPFHCTIIVQCEWVCTYNVYHFVTFVRRLIGKHDHTAKWHMLRSDFLKPLLVSEWHKKPLYHQAKVADNVYCINTSSLCCSTFKVHVHVHVCMFVTNGWHSHIYEKWWFSDKNQQFLLSVYSRPGHKSLSSWCLKAHIVSVVLAKYVSHLPSRMIIHLMSVSFSNCLRQWILLRS